MKTTNKLQGGKMKKDYQKETVEFLKPTSAKMGLTEGTEFKGSKEVYITRFSGKNEMMVQLTQRMGRKFIELPVSDVKALAKALANKAILDVKSQG